MIKIGIEVSSKNLRYDLLEHPGRYFFILVTDSRPTLCIRTCDFQGENIEAHVIDGLVLKRDGNLYSIFEDGINDTILELQDWKRQSCYGDEYPISPQLVQTITMLPDLMDWIISSILTKGRNLVICPFAST
jgi:hypothetical protein